MENPNALKEAMARAKEIAAKLQQSAPPDARAEAAKKRRMDGPGETADPNAIAQEVTNDLVMRKGLGPMLVEEVMIPNNIVGLVIGKGGEMITKLQAHCGCKMQVAPDPPPNMAELIHERKLTITGNSDSVNKAKIVLKEIQSTGKVPEYLAGGDGAGEFSSEIMIPKHRVGLIIGKGGETIKQLQEQAGCKMVLFQDGIYTNAPEKALRITGEREKVLHGKQLVVDLLEVKASEPSGPGPNRSMLPQDDSQGEEIQVQVPRSAVGLLIGPRGETINRMQQESGCRIQFKKDDVNGPTKTAHLKGTPEQVSAAQALIQDLLRSGSEQRGGGGGGGGRGPRPQFNNGFGGGPRAPWGGGQPGQQGGPRGPGGGPMQRGARPPFGGNRGPLPPGHKQVVIEVPSNRCGLVIGKGGEVIKFIKSETGVGMQIDRSVPESSPFRVFHVTGTDEMIQNALTIIREKSGDETIDIKGEGGGQGAGQGPGQGPPWGGPPQAQAQWPSEDNPPWSQQQQQQPPQQQQWGGQQQPQQQVQPSWGSQPQPQQPQMAPQGGGWPQNPQNPQYQGGWDQQQQAQQQQQPWTNNQNQQYQQPPTQQYQQPTPQSQQQPAHQPQQPHAQQPHHPQQPHPQQPQQQPQQPPQQPPQQSPAPQQQQQQQQWQQPGTTSQGQWAGQQQWGQPQQTQGPGASQSNQPAYQQGYQQVQPAATSAAPTTEATQAQAGQQSASQQDYSAAWALYYQQQQQYYQQYYQQQQQQQAGGAPASQTSAAPSSAAAAPTTAAQQGSAPSNDQMAQYQAQLAQFQKKYGQPQ